MDDRERLRRQLAFVLEADALKSVERRNYLADGSRRENTAEHSWHLALMATVLAEHASEPVDVGRVIVMLLVHDLVEIHAGDTFVYDDAAHADKAEREIAAARRLFGQLPADQGAVLRGLWEEFEERQAPPYMPSCFRALGNDHVATGVLGRLRLVYRSDLPRR